MIVHWLCYRKFCGRPKHILSTLFSGPRRNRTPHEFSEHQACRSSRNLYAHEQDLSVFYYAMSPRFSRSLSYKDLEMGNRVVSAFMPLSSNAAGQDLVRSVQHIVVVQLWTTCDIVIQHCLENFGFQNPDHELDGVLDRSCSSTVYFCQLHRALHKRQSASVDRSILTLTFP